MPLELLVDVANTVRGWGRQAKGNCTSGSEDVAIIVRKLAIRHPLFHHISSRVPNNIIRR